MWSTRVWSCRCCNERRQSKFEKNELRFGKGVLETKGKKESAGGQAAEEEEARKLGKECRQQTSVS